jgi:hypothetical protein
LAFWRAHSSSFWIAFWRAFSWLLFLLQALVLLLSQSV